MEPDTFEAERKLKSMDEQNTPMGNQLPNVTPGVHAKFDVDTLKKIRNGEISTADLLLYEPSTELSAAIATLVESNSVIISDTEVNASKKFMDLSNRYAELISGEKIPRNEFSAEFIKYQITANRLSNKICRNCLQESKKRLPTPARPWIACERCLQTFYCSGECQRANKQEHESVYCCKKDAPLENDLLLLTMLGPNTQMTMKQNGDFKCAFTIPAYKLPEGIRKTYGDNLEAFTNPQAQTHIMRDLSGYFGSKGMLTKEAEMSLKYADGTMYICITYLHKGVLLRFAD